MSDRGERPNETRQTPGASRTPYEKPVLRRIRLTADEVLAKGCKMAGPSSGFQGTGCLSGGCFNVGS